MSHPRYRCNARNVYLVLFLTMLTSGCTSAPDGMPTPTSSPDDDLDGVSVAAGDCDDQDPMRHPGAEELCDFTDNDCNGLVDDGIGILQIEGGRLHSLGLCPDGTVWAWGSNDSGQLGDGTTGYAVTPVRTVGSMSDIVAIAAGGAHSLALDADGQVWAWGENWGGQVGDETTTTQTSPAQIPSLSGIRAIAAGSSHSLALDANGYVWAWGTNSRGQLGDGTTTDHATPAQVLVPNRVQGIAAGHAYSLAVSRDGSVWAWGDNYNGQLGDGTHTDRLTPTRALILQGVQAVAAGIGDYYSHSLALDIHGLVWAWGANYEGQLGDGTTTGRTAAGRVADLSGIIAIAAGATHSLALDDQGQAYAWGGNYYGQLGRGDTTNGTTPVGVSGMSEARGIAAGDSHSLTVDDQGLVWAWGNNDYGQLGDGTLYYRYTPVAVSSSSP